MRRLLFVLLAGVLLCGGCAKAALAPTLEPAAEGTPEISFQPTSEAAPFPTPQLTPTPEPTPEPTPTPDPVKVYISGMTNAQLVGQMVMVGFTGTESLPEDVTALIRQYEIGNIILFGWNVEDFAQTTRLCTAIKSLNDTAVPMTISIDVEGGTVHRFVWSPRLTSQQALAEGGDTQAAYDQGVRIGQALADTGITMNLAPVLDVADPGTSFMGSRIFSSDPAVVGEMGAAEIQGLHAGGVLAAAKHFPGHGDTSVDPHNNTVVRDTEMDTLLSMDGAAFSAGIEAGVDAILVGHISLPNIDSQWVASLSPVIIGELLRGTMGFDGVVISDDMRMQAVAAVYGMGDAAVQHILAGGDIVLIGKGIENQRKVCDALRTALDNGTISRERAEASVYRVLRMKGFTG